MIVTRSGKRLQCHTDESPLRSRTFREIHKTGRDRRVRRNLSYDYSNSYSGHHHDHHQNHEDREYRNYRNGRYDYRDESRKHAASIRAQLEPPAPKLVIGYNTVVVDNTALLNGNNNKTNRDCHMSGLGLNGFSNDNGFNPPTAPMQFVSTQEKVEVFSTNELRPDSFNLYDDCTKERLPNRPLSHMSLIHLYHLVGCCFCGFVILSALFAACYLLQLALYLTLGSRAFLICVSIFVSWFSLIVTYFDSMRPGIVPPSPVSPAHFRAVSGHTFHLGYTMSFVNGAVVFLTLIAMQEEPNTGAL